ncbi:MAG: alpha-amylase family protein [Verrucomicrobiae bacterium]|nr:alpha-amylase family protein [Verrucomicrobiae bacterium]
MPEFPEDAVKNFDAGRWADELERGGVNLVALFAKDHFGNSFYNTAIGHKHRGLPQDFLMEAATECRARGIRTLAYLSVCWDQRAFETHPEWRFKNEKGEEVADTPVSNRVCMSTGYGEYTLAQLEEISRYPVDGFFLDIPYPYYWGKNHCTCEDCRRLFRELHGRPMPETLSWAESDAFTMATMRRWLLKLQAIITRNNPALVIGANSFGTFNVSCEVNELVEIGVWESQPAPGDYLGHSFSCRTARNDLNDVQIMTVRFYEGWGDLTLKPLPQIRTEFAVMLANGMTVNAGDQMNVDGTLEPAVYDFFEQAMGFVREREAILRPAESVRHVAILWPGLDPQIPHATVGRDQWETFYGCFRGAHKALVESHLQCDIVYAQLAGDLTRFPVILLPGVPGYFPEMAGPLSDYVSQGGLLVVVGESALQGETCPIHDVLGLVFERANEYKIAHFKPVPEVAGATVPIPLQHRGRTWLTRLAGARELAALHFPQVQADLPDRSFRHPSCPPSLRQRSPHPYCTVHSFGKGRAVYVAGSVFEAYWKTNHHWLRQFAEALLRHVDANIPYDVDASGRIEANLMRSGDDLLLNLVQYSLGHQGGMHAIAGIERVEPVHDIRCAVRAFAPHEVVLEPEGRRIPFEQAGDRVRFTVPRLEEMAIVRLVGGARTG